MNRLYKEMAEKNIVWAIHRPGEEDGDTNDNGDEK